MRPTGVHFVGSIGLDTVDDVFKTCGRVLGRRLKRLPDGEPGGRRPVSTYGSAGSSTRSSNTSGLSPPSSAGS